VLYEVWHKCLGHPYFMVLLCLLKNGLLNDKEQSSSTIFPDYTTCKLGKSKTLPYPFKRHRATYNFEIIHSDV